MRFSLSTVATAALIVSASAAPAPAPTRAHGHRGGHRGGHHNGTEANGLNHGAKHPGNGMENGAGRGGQQYGGASGIFPTDGSAPTGSFPGSGGQPSNPEMTAIPTYLPGNENENDNKRTSLVSDPAFTKRQLFDWVWKAKSDGSDKASDSSDDKETSGESRDDKKSSSDDDKEDSTDSSEDSSESKDDSTDESKDTSDSSGSSDESSDDASDSTEGSSDDSTSDDKESSDSGSSSGGDEEADSPTEGGDSSSESGSGTESGSGSGSGSDSSSGDDSSSGGDSSSGSGGDSSSGDESSSGGESSGGESSSGSDSSSGGESSSGSGGSSAPSSGSGNSTVPASGGTAASGTMPAAAGESTLTKTMMVTGEFDGGMKRFGRGVSCTGQSEGGDSDAVFSLAAGATLRNVIIGADQIEGVHCQGPCTIENVWWEDVCEDALTFKKDGDGTVTGGGAMGASDKVIQHNGAGTITVSGFTVSDFGKLYRSCGNCKTMGERHVKIDGVKATGGKATFVGINTNYGDTATITNSCITDTKAICEEFEGNDTGAEPKQISEEFNTEITSHPQSFSPADLPSESLYGMFLHFQKQGINPIQEVHLCVRLLHRLCLQDIEEDRPLREKMLSMISERMTFGTTVKFFLHRLGVDVDRDCFQNFVEKDLVRAIQGLQEHDVELSEILDEESCIFGPNAAPADAVGTSSLDGYDLVDEMIRKIIMSFSAVSDGDFERSFVCRRL
ncbi:unnamed protein product [Alternaria alternata]